MYLEVGSGGLEVHGHSVVACAIRRENIVMMLTNLCAGSVGRSFAGPRKVSCRLLSKVDGQ